MCLVVAVPSAETRKGGLVTAEDLHREHEEQVCPHSHCPFLRGCTRRRGLLLRVLQGPDRDGSERPTTVGGAPPPPPPMDPPALVMLWQSVPGKMHRKLLSGAFGADLGRWCALSRWSSAWISSWPRLLLEVVPARGAGAGGEGEGLLPVSPRHSPGVQERRRLGMTGNHPEASKNGQQSF